jgi:hypothetical protein
MKKGLSRICCGENQHDAVGARLVQLLDLEPSLFRRADDRELIDPFIRQFRCKLFA